MNIVRTIEHLHAALADDRRAERRIGFVPTMGALHDGHASLIRRARAECDRVVVSVFVNPMQFNDQRDLAAYPRDLTADARAAEAAGADLVFAPDVSELYPRGFNTSVRVAGVTAPLEGAARGESHFIGVTTIVAKLFNIVQADVAYFGQKDAQQAAVVKRMVRDLDFPIRIEVCATMREADGLAMSSRNVRLDPESRARATALYGALQEARRRIASGERDADAIACAARESMSARGVDAEYLEVVSPDDFSPVRDIQGDVIVAVAAYVGGVRLIDNMLISPAGLG
jgi:pantoate--beta-alanine ligase